LVNTRGGEKEILGDAFVNVVATSLIGGSWVGSYTTSCGAVSVIVTASYVPSGTLAKFRTVEASRKAAKSTLMEGVETNTLISTVLPW